MTMWGKIYSNLFIQYDRIILVNKYFFYYSNTNFRFDLCPIMKFFGKIDFWTYQIIYIYKYLSNWRTICIVYNYAYRKPILHFFWQCTDLRYKLITRHIKNSYESPEGSFAFQHMWIGFKVLFNHRKRSGEVDPDHLQQSKIIIGLLANKRKNSRYLRILFRHSTFS